MGHCGCSGAGTGLVLLWVCWGHAGVYETLGKNPGFCIPSLWSCLGKGGRQGPGGHLEVLAAGGGPAVSGWASGPGDPSAAGLSPSGCVSGCHIQSDCPHTVRLTVCPCSARKLQQWVRRSQPGGHGEQEGAQCLALSWGVHGSSMSMGSSMHEALGSLSEHGPRQAQPSGSGGSGSCRIPCQGC